MSPTSPSPSPAPRPGIERIAAYVPGKSAAPAGVKLHKLSSNEAPLGPSPAAVTAFGEAASNLALYPDGSAGALRHALAARHGLDAARIVCGAGSDELLTLIANAFLAPGDEAVHSAHGFLIYRIATLAAGATPVAAPERDLVADVDALLAAVTPHTKVLFLANPNNPTGTWLPGSEVRRLHAGLPPSVLLVLDAAYAEFVRLPDYEAGTALVDAHDNVVMTRTFSKIHGLAALRLGWCYGSAGVIDALNRIRGPFNVNAPAMAAGVAALGDVGHVARTLAHNDRWLAEAPPRLRALGLGVTPSVGNFLLVHFPDEPGRTARDADAFLTARGFILRVVSAYGLPGALRLSIGPDEAMEGVIAALGAFMRGEA